MKTTACHSRTYHERAANLEAAEQVVQERHRLHSFAETLHSTHSEKQAHEEFAGHCRCKKCPSATNAKPSIIGSLRLQRAGTPSLCKLQRKLQRSHAQYVHHVVSFHLAKRTQGTDARADAGCLARKLEPRSKGQTVDDVVSFTRTYVI